MAEEKSGGGKEGDTIEDRREGNSVGSNIVWGGDSDNITALAVAKGGRYVPSLHRYPLTMLRDVTDPVGEYDIPFLWHIPKAAGSTMKMILSRCFGLRRPERKRYPEAAEIVGLYVNMDVSSITGIARAKDMGLASTGLMESLVTSYLHEGSTLFTPRRRGRLFTVMRHPIETAVSLFRYLGYATWERFYREDFANMTLEEYATSPYLMDNWVTRYLTREETREITDRHVKLAVQILEKKCVIGMISELDETVRRLQQYFGWAVQDDADKDCLDRYIHGHRVNAHKHEEVLKGSKAWDLLAERNKYDLKVYERALDLFKEQGKNLLSPNGENV